MARMRFIFIFHSMTRANLLFLLALLFHPLFPHLFLLHAFPDNVDSEEVNGRWESEDESTESLGGPWTETERVEQYYQRNYTWPLQQYHPNTDGWKHLLQRRFRQIERIEDLDDRYEAWIMTMGSAWVIPNFTETG
jgi:hypothetical protein